MNFISKFFAKRALKKLTSNSSDETLLSVADEYLKRNIKDYNTQISVAQRLNQANLMRAHTQKLKQELRDGLDDDDDDYDDEEEEENDGMADTLLKGVVENVIKSKFGAPIPSSGSLPTANGAPSNIREQVEKLLGAVPDEKLEYYYKLIKERGLI